MKADTPRAKAAFSLIEIIIVISIAAFLVTMLLTSLPKAVYFAKKAKSTGNLRTMSSALMSYVSDHDGRLPEGAFRPTLSGTSVRYWYNAIDAYCGGTDFTPEGARRGDRPTWQNDPLKVYKAPIFDSSYAVNVGYGWNHGNFGYTADWSPEKLGWGTRIVEVDKPSQTIIIGTSSDTTNNSLGNLLIYANTNAAQRYGGKGLYLFIDGHVAAQTPQEITQSNNYLFLKKKP